MKQSSQPTGPVKLKQCLTTSKKSPSNVGNFVQLHEVGRNTASTGSTAGQIGSLGSSRSFLAATTCGGFRQHCWHTVMTAVCSKQHYRFFQLSLDGTVLRWGWKKYVLLYFVDALSFDPAGLRIVLHCVLEPDLCLTCPDADIWHQWVAGLQAALQMASGVPFSSPAIPAGAQEPHTIAEIFPQQSQQTPSTHLHSSVSTGSAAHHQDELPTCEQHSLQERPQLPHIATQSAPGTQAAEPKASCCTPLASTLHHQLVRTALYSQQTLHCTSNACSNMAAEPVLMMGGVSQALRKTHSVGARWAPSR